MKMSVLKTTFLAALFLAPPASFLGASDPPAPPAPQVAPAPPAAPKAPAPPEAPRRRKEKIVVASPEEEVVVDGDRVYVWGDGDEPEAIADLDDIAEGVHPFVMRMHGPAGRGFIGVRPIEMTPELRQHFGAPEDAGVMVGSVEPDGPAAKAGLQVGDIVTKVDGDPIASTRELVRTVRHKKSGETITVEVLRNRSAKSLTVTVAERKEKEIRVGELQDGMPGFRWKMKGPGHPMVMPPPDYPELEQRLDELEKKLKELEDRLPNR